MAFEAPLVQVLLFLWLTGTLVILLELVSDLVWASGLSWHEVVDDATQVGVYLVIVGEVAWVFELADFEIVSILSVHLLQLVALFAHDLVLLHLQAAGLPQLQLR